MQTETDAGIERLGSEFFVFGGLDDEIEKKLKSSTYTPEKTKRLFLEFLDFAKLEYSDSRRIVDLYDAAEFAYRAFGAPLIHPFRVTVSWLLYKDKASYDEISLGLCHNIREVGGGRLDAIEREFLSDQVRQHVEILTIDRSRERNRNYLKRYYQIIFDSGLMILKGFDKLDNFLGFVLRDVDRFYYHVVDDFVCPPLNKSEPRLGQYLMRISRYARDPEARKRFAVQTNT